jgi:hypothetical protein
VLAAALPSAACAAASRAIGTRNGDYETAPGGNQRNHHLGRHGLSGALAGRNASSKIARACISAISG